MPADAHRVKQVRELFDPLIELGIGQGRRRAVWIAIAKKRDGNFFRIDSASGTDPFVDIPAFKTLIEGDALERLDIADRSDGAIRVPGLHPSSL